MALLSDYFDHSLLNWHHFGTGPLLYDVRSVANQLTLNHKNFNATLHGFISPLVLDDYLKSYSPRFCINLSLSEGTPHSLIKAASLNIPIVATDVGDTSEICNSSTGILLSPLMSPSDLALTIFNSLPSLALKQNKLTIRNYAKTFYDQHVNFHSFYNSLF